MPRVLPIARSQIFIDWLSFTTEVPGVDHEKVKETLDLLCDAQMAKRVLHHEMLQKYFYMYELDFDGATVDIQIAPRSAADVSEDSAGQMYRYLRAELNPSNFFKASGAAIHQFSSVLMQILNIEEIDEFLSRCHITRIDLTFDVNVQIDQFLVFTTLGRVLSDQWKYEATGALGAITLGSTASGQILRVYDKRLEEYVSTRPRERRRELTRVIENWILKPVRPKTRFELRLRNVGRMAAFQSAGNAFESYTTRHRICPDVGWPSHFKEMFLDSVQVRGAQAALSLIKDEALRKRLRLGLQRQQGPSWWTPTLMWDEAYSALLSVFPCEAPLPSSGSSIPVQAFPGGGVHLG